MLSRMCVCFVGRSTSAVNLGIIVAITGIAVQHPPPDVAPTCETLHLCLCEPRRPTIALDASSMATLPPARRSCVHTRRHTPS